MTEEIEFAAYIDIMIMPSESVELGSMTIA